MRCAVHVRCALCMLCMCLSLHVRTCRKLLSQSCQRFKELFVGIRERANRVLGFAKILRKVDVYSGPLNKGQQ